ncbi:MAG: alanine racemase [Thermotogae bacterium]|nr:alanine racemase [Thermotogota bacterium]
MFKVILRWDNLRHNYRTLKEEVGNYEIIPVVKANAYGHGTRDATLVLKEEGAHLFVISTIDDYLRVKDLEDVDFLMLYPDYTDREQVEFLAGQGNVIFNLYDFYALEVLPKGARVHINVDTGMNRVGVKPEEFPRLYEEAKSKFRVEGAYSHFPIAKDPEFSRRQIELFDTLTRDKVPFRHINNSEGLLHYGKVFDGARIGILLYGYGRPDMKPVKTVLSKIVQVKRIRKGESVSYDRRFIAPEDGFLAVVPVGYAHGVRRVENYRVFSEGKWYEVAGHITMDALMLYSRENDFHVGQWVELLGENNRADHIARIWSTVPYEPLVEIGTHPIW